MKNNLKEEYAKMFQFLGVNPPVGVKYGFHHVAKNKNEANPAFLDKLQKRYQEPNEALFDLIGYQIPEWDFKLSN